ncbi:hypothetical protein [Halobacillus sp. Marseille-Q1614]
MTVKQVKKSKQNHVLLYLRKLKKNYQFLTLSFTETYFVILMKPK